MLTLLAITALGADPAFLRDRVSTARIEADLRALTGEDPLPDGTRLTSRAIQHPQIADAESWLVNAFTQIDGLTVRVESFSAANAAAPLHNVIAELPGEDPSLPPWC